MDTFTYRVNDGYDYSAQTTVTLSVNDLPTGTIALASTNADAVHGNKPSWGMAVSGNGQYLAFVSEASNLVADDTNGVADVFRYDCESGETIRVSVTNSGAQANDESWDVAISSDGRYLAFASDATNLVAGDTNGKTDIFLRDITGGTTTLISKSNEQDQDQHRVPANNICWGPSLSVTTDTEGAHYAIAYVSDATNLVDDNADEDYTNDDTNGASDVFLYDQRNDTTTRLSTSAGVLGNANSDIPVISADGQHVAFASDASNLVATDENGCQDVFVKALVDNSLIRVSVPPAGGEGNLKSWGPSLSADGARLTFVSQASNLVSGDTNGCCDVFLFDQTAGTLTRISHANDGTQGNGASWDAAISADGGTVALVSYASNFSGNDSNGRCDLFRYVLPTETVPESLAPVIITADGALGNADSWEAALSADGQRLAFRSAASNLVPLDLNGDDDVFTWLLTTTP
jgi:Tol biopolymer transport system component